MQYNERIKEERKKKGYSQAKIAEYLKTTQQQVNKYENKIQEIPLRRFIELAELFDVSLDYLAGRTENPDINR